MAGFSNSNFSAQSNDVSQNGELHKAIIHSSYSLASPEECKLMRTFAQINFSQFAVRSRGERSHFQQRDDSQISYL